MNILLLLVLCLLFVQNIVTAKKRNDKKHIDNGIFSGWLQSSNFSTIEYSQIKKLDVLNTLKTHDWRQEIKNELKAINKDFESYSAGYGIVYSNRHILHICPNEEGNYLVHYHYKLREKSLFIFQKYIPLTYTILNESEENINSYIDLFFYSKFKKLNEIFDEREY